MGKTLAMTKTDKGIISRTCKEHLHISGNMTETSIEKNGQSTPPYFTTEESQSLQSVFLRIREAHIKIIKYPPTPVELTKLEADYPLSKLLPN